MQDNPKDIPYIAYEGSLARMERTTTRLFKVIIALIIALFLSNALWLYAWTRYDYVDTDTEASDTVMVDAGSGTANYIGNDGDITNGTDNGKENDTDTNPDTDTDTQK